MRSKRRWWVLQCICLSIPLKAPSLVRIFVGYISDGFGNVIEALRKLESFVLSDCKKVEPKAR